MTAYHAKLGRTLDQLRGRTPTRPYGPLMSANGNGKQFAVWPEYANGMLLVGSTGNGKSTLLRFMVADLARSPGTRAIHLADGKFSGAFLMFKDVRGIASTATTASEITATVRGYFTEVERRYRELADAREQAQQTRQAPDYTPPGPLYLILDEYLNWVLALSERDRKDVIGKLVRIGSIGREVSCRLVIATQRPGTKEVDTGLPGLLKAQLKLRVASCGMLGLDSIEARMAFDEDAYADRMELEVGAGFAKAGRHEVAFVVPWLADPTDPATGPEDRESAWRVLPREAGS